MRTNTHKSLLTVLTCLSLVAAAVTPPAAAAEDDENSAVVSTGMPVFLGGTRAAPEKPDGESEEDDTEYVDPVTLIHNTTKQEATRLWQTIVDNDNDDGVQLLKRRGGCGEIEPLSASVREKKFIAWNAYRELAGAGPLTQLPQSDPAWNQLQSAAYSMARKSESGEIHISHNLKEDGFPCVSDAAASGAHSSLGASPIKFYPLTMFGMLADKGDKDPGHRVQLLDSQMVKAAYGQASVVDAKGNRVSVMAAGTLYRDRQHDYYMQPRYSMWPGPGYFPRELIAFDYWSATLPDFSFEPYWTEEGKFVTPEITVTVKAPDGETITSRAELSGYARQTIVWKSFDADSVRKGGTYKVTIKSPKKTIEYQTTIFRADRSGKFGEDGAINHKYIPVLNEAGINSSEKMSSSDDENRTGDSLSASGSENIGGTLSWLIPLLLVLVQLAIQVQKFAGPLMRR